MDALALVRDLDRQGVKFRLGPDGVSAYGQLCRLTSDYRAAIARVRDDLEVLVRWLAIQDKSEARFGCPESRLYPFLRLDLTHAPIVRTTYGKARVVRVVSGGCDVVFEREIHKWERECLVAEKRLPFPPMTRLGLDAVHPPSAPEVG